MTNKLTKENVAKELFNLRKHALKSEQENDRALTRMGLNKDSKKIIADKQYWNGYLDAITNLEKHIKKLR